MQRTREMVQARDITDGCSGLSAEHGKQGAG